METKICANCEEEKPITSFKRNLDGSIRRHSCNVCMGKRERNKLKIEFLEAFNWQCSCCGESDPRFLTLDHIENDGNEHRQNYNEQQIMYQAKKAGWPKDRYQCLCFNCNCGKSVNRGVCPHKCQTKEDYMKELMSTQYNLGRSNVVINTSNVAARVAGRKEQAAEERIAKALHGLASLGIYKTPDEIKSLLNL